MAVQAFLRHADLVAVKCLPRSGVARVLWRVLFQFFFFFPRISTPIFTVVAQFTRQQHRRFLPPPSLSPCVVVCFLDAGHAA